MNDKTRIMIVDDNFLMREMLVDALAEDYDVAVAENGADAVMLAQAEHPALILLDIEMPGMDGYETCRQLKQKDATAPVIFVSGCEQIEERIRGYEVGGSDYVVKPFNRKELKAKIAHLLGMVDERARLSEMASYATSTAMTAMTSMSEMGALLESLKKFNASVDEQALAEAVLSGLTLYGLDGVVRVGTPQCTVSMSVQGAASPLEISVIEHMATMERIVQFRNRVSIHYPHVALLVNNMPLEDADRCGRLRDHLAMLVEGAEMRAAGIAAEHEAMQRGMLIERMMERITGALTDIDKSQRQSRMEIRVAYSALTDQMEKALLRVALTNEQEALLSSIVTDGIEDILNVQSAEAELQNKLSAIVHEMRAMA